MLPRSEPLDVNRSDPCCSAPRHWLVSRGIDELFGHDSSPLANPALQRLELAVGEASRGALRRRLAPSAGEPSEPFVLGELVIDYAERRVSVAGRAVHLTPTKYELLFEMSVNAGRVLTLDSLLDRVWGLGRSGGRGSVRTYVKRLRRKLGEDTDSPKYIFAEPRVGYRMPKGGQTSDEPPTDA